MNSPVIASEKDVPMVKRDSLIAIIITGLSCATCQRAPNLTIDETGAVISKMINDDLALYKEGEGE